MHADFEIYGSEEDLLSLRNPWQFANYDDDGVGFPRDSGPKHKTDQNWAGIPGSRFYRPDNNFAFYVLVGDLMVTHTYR